MDDGSTVTVAVQFEFQWTDLLSRGVTATNRLSSMDMWFRKRSQPSTVTRKSKGHTLWVNISSDKSHLLRRNLLSMTVSTNLNSMQAVRRSAGFTTTATTARSIRVAAPQSLWAKRRKINTTPAYEGHIPLNSFENAFLAVGSAVMSLVDPRRGGA